MPKVAYQQFEDQAMQVMVAEIVADLTPYFPAWVLDIFVVSQPWEHTEHVAVCLESRYKRIWINIGPGFYGESAAEKVEDVRHEFFHAILGEMVDWVFLAMIDPMKQKDEAMHDVLKREFTDRSERATQELVHLFRRLLDDKEETT